jgi:arabinofuranosyltransferase
MTHKRTMIGVAVLAAIYVCVADLTGVGLVDDTYIFLRYAGNIVAGHGPVFNPGDPVEGYTSPLWLACVTVLSALETAPSFAGYFSATIGFLSIVIVSRRSYLGGLALAAHPGFVFWSFSGMETALAGCLLAWAWVLVLGRAPARSRSLVSGCAFASACLTRPEFLMLGPVLAASLLTQTPGGLRARTQQLTVFLLPMIAFGLHAIWRHSYYGVWLPNTAYAKAGVGFDVLLGHGIRYVPEMWFSWLVTICLVALYSRQNWLLAGTVVGIWSLVVAAMGGDFFPFARFGIPVLPLLAALGPAGGLSDSRRVLSLGVVAVSALMLASPDRHLAANEVRLADGWRETGLWLNRHLPPESTLATLVAGSIPFYAGTRTIDLLGLTNARIGRHGRIHRSAKVGHQRSDPDYVLSLRPAVIVLQDSGQRPWPRFKPGDWPRFVGEELEYVRAVQDLLDHNLTKELYVYRHDRMADGTFLEALWLKRPR